MFIVRPPYIVSSGGQLSKLTGESWTFSGGTIHVIDSLMQLPLPTSLLLTAYGLDEMAALMLKTHTSDLFDYRGLGIFAPTDQAFNAISSEFLNASEADYSSSSDRLINLAKYHLFNGTSFAAGPAPNRQILTLSGKSFEIPQSCH